MVADVVDFESERPSRVRLIPFDDIEFATTARYLVKGIIPRTGLAVVWGPPKSGKSFWTFDLVMHVALGWEYRGRRVQPGAVVYCSFEGQAGLSDRVEAFRQKFLAEGRDPIPFYLEPATLDLVVDHPELLAVIRRQLAKPPVIVVLDTLNRSLRGSESSDEDMTAYIRAADAIREAFDCLVIIVHHCGVDGTRPRGHTSLAGAVDTQISVRRDNAGNVSTLVELCKDGPEGEATTSRLEVVEIGFDDDADILKSCVVVPTDVVAAAGARLPTGATKTALTLLEQAIDEAGEEAPGGLHFAGARYVCPVALWRSYCEMGSISEGTKDAAAKAFKRSAAKLQDLGIIGVWAEKVWIR